MRIYLICLSILFMSLFAACSEETQAPPSTPVEVQPIPEAQPQIQPKVEAQPQETQPSTPQAEPQKTEATPVTTVDTNKSSLELAKTSGCMACHAIDKKMVGPAWKDVAKRYADDPKARSKLITKVAKGGKGNWTEVVGNMMMPPYSPRVSDENIGKLVDFVLSLKDK